MPALILLLAPAFASDILINEVVYDPASSDDGLEWIELCNAGSSTIDLSGWTIENAGTSWSAITIGGNATLTGTLVPGAYMLVGYGSTTNPGAFAANLQNGGGSTGAADGLRIKNASGTVMDTVIYEGVNASSLVDDSGGIATTVADGATNGESIARLPDCTDTNDSFADFWTMDAAEVTPGAENQYGGGTGSGTGSGSGGQTCDNPAGAAQIVINEFEPNPDWSDSSADDRREWVELYNAGSGTVDLSDWELQFETKPDDWGASSGSFVIPAGVSLAPGAFLVLAGDEVASLYDIPGSAQVVTATGAGTRDIDMGTASSNADGVRLVDCEGTAVDTVIYGHQSGVDDTERNSDGFLDDDGVWASSLAPKGAAGAVIGRLADGVDTNQSGVDFGLMQFPTPGFSNTTEPDCPGRDDIKINEFVVAPEGGGNGGEFVELYNAGSQAIDLTGWGVGAATSGNPSFFLLDGVSLAPGDYYVVAGSDAVENVDVVDDGMSLGNATSNADMVQLLHVCGLPADTVLYGPTYLDDDGLPQDEWVDDAGVSGVELDDRLGPKAGTGESLARCRDGEDSDDSYADFVIDGSPTPGVANPDTGCEPPVPPRCEPGDGTVKINEIYPNPSGTDSGNEFIELYNTSSETVVLDAWTLQWGTSSFGSDFSFPRGTEIAPGGYLLIGDSEVPGDVYASMSLGNASTAPDGVRLVDCREGEEPVVQDTVLYGASGDEPEDLELLDDAGGQSMGAMPSEGKSLGRLPNGEDTDDNSVDFVSNLPPTPGAPNTEGGGDGDGDDGGGDSDDPKGCGCGGDKAATTSKSTDKRCAVVEPRGGLVALVLALVAVRRRRRDADGAEA